ncbi:MAG TPA: hypothetical protein ENJ93_05515 [Chloroflexi bacterium]|nr:hypothetical protein [Chloroflexota bacterium]
MNDFVICIDNESNPASLIVGKVYRVLPDADAEVHDMIRIIDEDTSEIDGYLYPVDMFVPIDLPEAARRAVLVPAH